MIDDISAVIWKEWKEMFMQRSSRGGLMGMVIILVLLGVILPLQVGKEWLTSPQTILAWSWLPVLLALNIVTDAIAGERERHTLETLLASRLSDLSILLGKIFAAVLYGCGIAFFGLLLGAVTINLLNQGEGLMFYPTSNFLLTVGMSLLATLLISALGVLVSLRAPTARQAYQKLSVVILVLVLLPSLLVQFLPAEIINPVFQFFSGLDLVQTLSKVLVVLLVLDIFLLVLATFSFRRTKLMETID